MALPVESPAYWTGCDLADRTDWIYEFSSSPELARRVQHDLENGPGVALIQGARKQLSAPEDFLNFTSRIGTPISQSAEGELVFSVRDAGYADHDPRSRGPNTKKKLSFHTDRCDVIAFMCQNQAKTGGENEIVSSVALYNEILRRRPDLLKILMEPFHYKRHTVDLGNERPYCRQPIFSFCEGHFAANFLRVLIERAHQDAEIGPLSDRQREALDYLEAVAAESKMHHRFTQEPGDILLLNNWVTFHRRTEFEDHLEPEKKRHILRVWLSMPNSRPLDPMFKDNYGAVQAGAIRGGMQAKQ
ncbi:MAG: TauD/TfdA family dioxygenase [Limisphaerales bacterium]